MTIHSDTQSFEAVQKKTEVSNERSEVWQHSPKSHLSANAPFQNYILSNVIKNTYENEFNLQLQFSLFASEDAYES